MSVLYVYVGVTQEGVLDLNKIRDLAHLTEEEICVASRKILQSKRYVSYKHSM